MEILVISDSHLYGDDLIRVTEKYKNQVDMMIHCGDSSLPQNDPTIQLYDIIVKGNHDEEDFPIYQIYNDICVTHGHYFHVYSGYEEMIALCQKNHCKICFHGHTHVPTYQVHQGIHFINPGSLMMNRGSYAYGTYALVKYNDPFVEVQYYHHHNDTVCPLEILEEGKELLEEFKNIVKNKAKLIY